MVLQRPEFFKSDFSYNKKGLEITLNEQKKEMENIVKETREQFLKEKKEILDKRNKNKNHKRKLRRGDYCLIKKIDSPKFRPIYSLNVYKVTKVQDFTAKHMNFGTECETRVSVSNSNFGSKARMT